MMAFDRLLEDSIAGLDGLPCSAIALPEEFAKASRPEKQGTLELTNRFFRIADYGEVRTVLISAPKIDIINLFFFPAPDRDLPLYAMNCVVLGQRPLAAVLDAACLVADMASAPRIAEQWQAARAQYRHLPQAEDMPGWYRACRSGHDFFVRPTDGQALAELGQAHRALWRTFLDGIPEAGSLPPQLAALHQECLVNYKHHHRINSPGIPLLRRSFGESWTEQYLAQILFH